MKLANDSSLIIHPQAEKLRRQNRQLQAESVRLVVERDFLKDVAAPQIFAEYQSKIGVFELRVFQYECEIRAFIRRIEMANAALNRGEQPVYQLIEQEIQTEFANWREKIAAHIREIKAAREFENLPSLSRAESRKLKEIYRKLALLLHPDISGSADERRRKLWLQAAQAYKNADLRTLQTLLLLTSDESAPAARDGENILENLQKRSAQLKTVCEKFLNEIDEIKNSAPYALHKILDDEAETAGVINELGEKLELLREKRLQLIEHWSEIMRYAADAEIIEIPAEPPDVFAEEDWAEIIF